MNKMRLLLGRGRLARALGLGVVLALGLGGLGATRQDRELVAPNSPGVPPVGLRYFRLQPSVPDTIFRLLVIPVQFPEDGVLGGGGETEILEKLNGSDLGNLAGYYVHETAGRLHIVSTLAPLVIAPHSRAYYTTEGGAFGSNGLDPATYPHNGQGLVDDVTRILADRVDYRLFDNTKDGIVDGLLVLHSGPESAETSAGALPPEVLVAHAFTLPEPADRGGSQIFPYALASTRDGIGVWAHEVGHLFGLPDLYVANSLCFGPGLGEWSLMATGANRNGGDNPTGLDAFSLQLLGMTPQEDDGSGVLLSQGVFLRASDPGEETGPQYYLVDYREAGDGPAGSTPARVVYLVNEDAVDNRSCSNPSDTYRPLVRVAGVICPGNDICTDSFYEACELCPNVGFTFQNSLVHAQSGALPPVVLSGVKLGIPEIGLSGLEEQRVYLSFHNVDADDLHTVSVDAYAVDFDSVCTQRTTLEITVAPDATETDSSFILVSCSGAVPLPRKDVLLFVRVRVFDNLWSRADTLVLPANHVGWEQPNFCGFDWNGWSPSVSFPPCPPDCCPNLMFALLTPLADLELVSPWISIPTDGQLILTHQWNLTALSPDVALDGGQVRLRRSVGEDIVLEPPLGWGYTAERGVGNALGGQPVLSGSGLREHVFDLSGWSGEVAQIVLEVAGDGQDNLSFWKVWPFRVQSVPGISFTLALDPSNPGTLVAETDSPPRAVELALFQGWPGVSPTDTVFSGAWNGQPRIVLGHFEGPQSRFELVWSDSTGATASSAGIFELPVTPEPQFLLPPFPNPIHGDVSQTWTLRVADNGPMGSYRLRLVGLNGGVILEHSVRIDVPGTRLIPWDGRDREGRTISSGIYFLEARRPDGVSNGQRIVVLR